jgi:hypothetical protein
MDTLMKPMSLALVWKHWLQHIKATLPDKTMRDPIAQKKDHERPGLKNRNIFREARL